MVGVRSRLAFCREVVVYFFAYVQRESGGLKTSGLQVDFLRVCLSWWCCWLFLHCVGWLSKC